MTVSCFSEMSPSIFSSKEPWTLYYLDPAPQILTFQACASLSDIFFSLQRKKNVDSEGIAKICSVFQGNVSAPKAYFTVSCRRVWVCHISP